MIIICQCDACYYNNKDLLRNILIKCKCSYSILGKTSNGIIAGNGRDVYDSDQVQSTA